MATSPLATVGGQQVESLDGLRRAWPSISATMTRWVLSRMRGGGEGVPADVCGDGLVIKAAISAEAADDAAGTADRQLVAEAVEQQRRRAVGARPSGCSSSQSCSTLTQQRRPPYP